MSKSYGNAVTLASTDEEIDKLVISMITDPQRVRRADPGRPEVCTVFAWHKAFGASQAEIDEVYRGCTTAELGCVDDKRALAARVRDTHRPDPRAPRGPDRRPVGHRRHPRRRRRPRPRHRRPDPG